MSRAGAEGSCNGRGASEFGVWRLVMACIDPSPNRRRFLRFLAGSPLFALGGHSTFAGEGAAALNKLPDPISWASQNLDDLIKSPKDALNVFDFEPVCRTSVPPAHFGYMASGIDDEVANREGFLKFQLRPRRLVDVTNIDMSTEILGLKYDTPIIVAPVGGQKAFHTDGEIATAKASKVGNHLQILATGTTSSVEEVTAARDVSTLRDQQVGVSQNLCNACRTGWLPDRCSDGGSDGPPQSGDPPSNAAHR